MPTLNPPGPRGNWLLGSMLDLYRDSMQYMRDMATYGDITRSRVGPFHVYLLNNPEAIQEFLVTHRDKHTKDPRDAKLLGRFLGLGLLTNEGENHKQQRKLVQPAFHMKRIQAYADVMVAHTTALLDTWRTGSTIDVDHEMTKLTLNIVTKTLFNANVTAAEAEAVSQALDELQADMTKLSTLILPVPAWLPLAINRRIKANTAVIDRIVWRVIEERRAAGTDDGDHLRRWGHEVLQQHDGDEHPECAGQRQRSDNHHHGLRQCILRLLDQRDPADRQWRDLTGNRDLRLSDGHADQRDRRQRGGLHHIC